MAAIMIVIILLMNITGIHLCQNKPSKQQNVQWLKPHQSKSWD